MALKQQSTAVFRQILLWEKPNTWRLIISVFAYLRHRAPIGLRLQQSPRITLAFICILNRCVNHYDDCRSKKLHSDAQTTTTKQASLHAQSYLKAE
jgi:hypothetical protein